jgi:ABC-2 type transport system ATP-binding protein
MTRNGQPVLDVAGLRMRYGANDVLRDVDLRADQGQVLCLLGPNGAGKSTTVEILEGFRIRSAGRVRVLGTDPARADERWRARVGIVLQTWRDHGRWRVRELLAHLAAYYVDYSTEQVRRPWDVDELLATVGLTGAARQKIRVLSGGQRRRLDVAIGIVGRPELLFLDEPTAGLDPNARREFHDLVRGLAAEQATTILLTTHDLPEAEALADRIVILDRGRIVADGTTAELTRRIAGAGEVRWSRAGQALRETTRDPTGFAFELFHRHGNEIEDLEVRRPSLEDAYLALVHGDGEA